MNRFKTIMHSVILTVMMILSGCSEDASSDGNRSILIEYTGIQWRSVCCLNDNIPEFSESDLTEESFEEYSDLDSLGRCESAYASIGEDLMPTEKRGSIGQVKPTGWHTVKYDNVDGKYLYNRCHLIG